MIKIIVDSGCNKVLIPEKDFSSINQITKLIWNNVKLLPYGSDKYLEVKGHVKETFETVNGSTCQEYIYAVGGPSTETIVGLEVALGVLGNNLECVSNVFWG